MTGVRTRLWAALERWRAEAFLSAGGLLLASPTHVSLEWFFDVTLPPWLVALFVLPGLLASLVGVLGLYPRVAGEAPRFAVTGAVAVVLAAANLIVVLGWVLGGSLLTAVSGMAVGMPPEFLFASLAPTLTTGFVLFGLACLQSGAPSRTVGSLLLSMAAPWVVVLAAMPVFGSAFPPWLTLAIYGPIPFVMLATGYALRTQSRPTGRVSVSTGTAPP